jgi:hypothetical protein
MRCCPDPPGRGGPQDIIAALERALPPALRGRVTPLLAGHALG